MCGYVPRWVNPKAFFLFMFCGKANVGLCSCDLSAMKLRLSLPIALLLMGLLAACGRASLFQESESGMSPAPAPAPERVVNILVDDVQLWPPMISLKKGEHVRLQIVGVNGTHGFSIRGMGLTVKVTPGQTISVGLPTDTPGIYSYYCSPACGGGGQEDAEGQIVITE